MPDVAQTQPTSDVASWSVHSLDPYGVTLRYPSDVVIVPAGGVPTPAPRFRVWFQLATIASSPIGGLAPPPLAVDVFDNASGDALDAWLARSGAVPQTRAGREQVQVGGVAGIRVTGSLQLAPNVFYYVARGAFIYRFTPVGPVGDQMLGTVSFRG